MGLWQEGGRGMGIKMLCASLEIKGSSFKSFLIGLMAMVKSCLRVSIALIKQHMTKSNSGKKGFVWLTYPNLQSVEGSQGRNSNWAVTLCLSQIWVGITTLFRAATAKGKGSFSSSGTMRKGRDGVSVGKLLTEYT